MGESNVRVGDVMTRDVVSVTPETPLKDVAAVLVERGVSGLPVCDADGAVVGVLSEADLLVKQGGSPQRPGGLFAWLVETASGSSASSPPATCSARSPTVSAPAMQPSGGG